MFLVEPDKLDSYVVFYLSCIISYLMAKRQQSKLADVGMCYDVNRCSHLTNRNVFKVSDSIRQSSSEVASKGIT